MLCKVILFKALAAQFFSDVINFHFSRKDYLFKYGVELTRLLNCSKTKDFANF